MASERERWALRDNFPPSNERLDELRRVGDEPADEFVAQHFVEETVRPLMEALVERKEVARDEVYRIAETDDDVVAADLHGLFAAAAAPLSDVRAEDIEIAQNLFSEYGPEILMILGCYSLPAAYSAEKGVEVLAETGYLKLRTDRRLAETAQIIVDVMSQGLGPGEAGREAAERTRLIHAAIRRLVENDPSFDEDFVGVPINQEDLAATLMTFSYLVLDGLNKMNMRVTPTQREAYVDTWRHLGRLLGVTEELLPESFEEAKALTEMIQARQIKPSDTGRELLEVLIDTLEDKTFDGLPQVMMRMFLPKDVADAMRIPRNAVALVPDWAFHGLIKSAGLLDSWVLRWFGRRSMIMRDVSLEILEGIMGWQLSDRGDKPEFVLPDSLDWYRERTDRRREPISRIVLDTALAGGPGSGATKRHEREERFSEIEHQRAARSA